MSDVKRLLEEATPLPWRTVGQRVEPDHTNHSFTGVQFSHAEDAALVVYAVNHLPDYEAAVEALERLLDYRDFYKDAHRSAYEDARAALKALDR